MRGSSIIPQHADVRDKLHGRLVAEFGAGGDVDVLGRVPKKALVRSVHKLRLDWREALPSRDGDRSPGGAQIEASLLHTASQRSHTISTASTSMPSASFVAASGAAFQRRSNLSEIGFGRIPAAFKADDRSVASGTHQSVSLADISPEKHPLPAWAQIIIGILVMLVITGTYSIVASKLRSPLPAGADHEALLEALQQALDKAEHLELELEGRQEVDEMFSDTDDDEATDKEQRAAEEADRRKREIQEAAAKIADAPEALTSCAHRVQGAFLETMDGARGRVENFARLESSEVYSRVQAAVEEHSESIPRWVPPDWMTQEGTFVLPPLMQLISGLTATSQIRLIRFFNQKNLMLSGILIILSVATFAVDWNKRCADKMVWVWHIGLLSLTSVDTAFRIAIIRRASKGLDHLRLERLALEKESAASSGIGNAVFDFFGDIKRRSSKFFDAFFRYQLIVESWSYSLAHFFSFLSLGWGGVGLAITIHDIIADSLACDANFAVRYLHVYSFIYVVLLTWNILGVILWITFLVSGSKYVHGPLIQLAKYIDDDMMQGMPVSLSLVQSFVLKDSADLLSLKARQVLHEIEEVQKQIVDLEERLRLRKRYRERVHELNQQAPTEEEFMERCQDRVTSGLDEIRPLVGLVAANVTTTQGPDPTAAGSTTLPPSAWKRDPAGPSSFAASVARRDPAGGALASSSSSDEAGESF